MQALSMIEMGVQPADTVTPAKVAEKSDQQFGKVLSEKRQPSQQQESKPVDRQPETSAGSREKQIIAHNHKTETKPETHGQNGLLNRAVEVDGVQSAVEVNPQLQVKVQHPLVDLLKVMVKGEPMEAEGRSDSIKTLLTDLVQQLESADFKGEQVLAGIDLSVLTGELQTVSNASDNTNLLAQLVTQLEQQLADESGMEGNGELAVAPLVGSLLQQDFSAMPQNLQEARQLLQKALDTVVAQKTAVVETVVAEESVAIVAEEIFLQQEEPAAAVDPRFAEMLKPRTEQRPVAQQAQSSRQLQHSGQQASLKQSEAVDQVLPEQLVVPKQAEETAQIPATTVKQVLENLADQGQRNLQPQGHLPVQGVEAAKAMPQTLSVQLPSGQQVAEGQIFDQVVTQISGSVNGESGRMVLRLQPAELGSLKLELVVEGDRIRANLHAQSHQVQEVLERNLPQLRNALAEQGLKIDQFQVNVDQRQPGGQFENLAQQQQHGSEKQPGWHQQTEEQEEQSIPLAHLMQNGGGGISLHV